MRIVIILCPCPTPRKVLGPETLAARRGPSACSFDCDTNRCHLGIPGTQKPWHPETLAPRNPLHSETLPPSNPWHPETSGITPPHLNFARNSPATLSNFESTSLEFCGFLKVVNLSDHRITCEIDGELRCAEPNASTHSPHHTLTPTTRELARTNIDIPGILWSVDERSRHGRRIVMACARLRRWCAHSNFALQLLGF